MAALLLTGTVRAQSIDDAALLDMREAFRREQPATLSNLLPRVRGHVLEPLASYWEAKARLETASADDMRSALARHPGSYWEDRLRNDWLLVLARRGDWANFEAELPRYRMNDDRQVQCYALMRDAAARRLDPALAAQRVAELWHAQRDPEEGCATAAQALLASGHLPADAVWQRARLSLEAGRARPAVQAVQLLNADWATTVSQFADRPDRFLDERLTAIAPRTKELVTLAIIRLASTDLPAAVRELESARWRLQLTREEQSWAWGTIGKRTAQQLGGDALRLFAQGDMRHMHADHLAWYARAALRAGAWETLLAVVTQMGEAQRREPAWVYWRARALQALKKPDALAAAAEARALLEPLAGRRGFYEQLALEELGRLVDQPPPVAAPTPQELEAAQRNPGLQRALAAFRLGLRGEAVREWHYTVALHTPGGMGERELLAAAALACQNSLWDRCINTSERTALVEDHSQRYPTPYRDEVVRRARDIGLDPAYVYGLIRQESRFVTEARSGVGASGLMQVMPATARWTARRIGLTAFQPHQLNDRDTNITIGTAYLKLALDDFEGSLPLAAAAYNAGPGRPRSWRNGPTLVGEAWIENIPFEETRDYVKRVLANTTNYAALLTGQPQSLRARLGVVGPRTDESTINRELP